MLPQHCNPGRSALDIENRQTPHRRSEANNLRSLIDLHLHSRISDGTDTPSELVTTAARSGAELIALTDHDAVDGIEEARSTGCQLGVEIIPGVELSCHTATSNVHILGYFKTDTDPSLLEELRHQQDLRRKRNTHLIEELQARNLDITIEDVLKHGTGPSVGRPHFAAALMEKGYVDSVDEAFRRYLSDGRPGISKQRGMDASQGIQLIKRAGGVAVWAHPYIGGTVADDLQPHLEELVNSGLDGIECWYGSFTPEMRKRLATIAEKKELLITGGSDYHGKYKPGLLPAVGRGDLAIPRECADELLSRLN